MILISSGITAVPIIHIIKLPLLAREIDFVRDAACSLVIDIIKLPLGFLAKRAERD